MRYHSGAFARRPYHADYKLLTMIASGNHRALPRRGNPFLATEASESLSEELGGWHHLQNRRNQLVGEVHLVQQLDGSNSVQQLLVEVASCTPETPTRAFRLFPLLRELFRL